MLKLAGDIVGPSLTSIFKSSIDNGIFPSEWKVEKVTPIFKEGAKSDLNKYRPISVLPIVSKFLEKTIYQQLYDYLNENKLLSNYQSGFPSLYEICVSLENQQIERVNHTKSLGVTIDDRLSWSNYINEVCKKYLQQ